VRIDGKKENAVNLIMPIMSRKEEIGEVVQAGSTASFNTPFIFRKEGEIQAAMVAIKEEACKKKKSRLGTFPSGFFIMYFYKVFYYFFNSFLRPKPATPIRTIPSRNMEVCSEIASFKFNAKACPVNTKLIKNIANKETIKIIKTFFMNFLPLQKSNLKFIN